MGWSRGSTLAEEIWSEIRGYIPEDKRQGVAEFVYSSFCDEDADGWEHDSQLERDRRGKIFEKYVVIVAGKLFDGDLGEANNWLLEERRELKWGCWADQLSKEAGRKKLDEAIDLLANSQKKAT